MMMMRVIRNHPRRFGPRRQPRTWRTGVPLQLIAQRGNAGSGLGHAGVAAAAFHVAAERVVGQDGADGVANKADLAAETGPLLGGEKVAVGGVGGGHQLAHRLLVAR